MNDGDAAVSDFSIVKAIKQRRGVQKRFLDIAQKLNITF